MADAERVADDGWTERTGLATADREAVATVERAIEHHQAGRLAEAERIYWQVLDREPNDVDALHLLGLIAYQVGRGDAAIDLIERAIAINPDVATFHGNLGNVLREQGRLNEAVASYQRAIELEPGFGLAYLNLGIALKQKGDFAAAVAAFRCALTVDPDDEEAREQLRLAEQSQHLGPYQQRVLSMRRSPYIDWPAHVHLETMAVCNAACVFCPYSTLDRQGEKMPDTLISKIIDDLTDIPRLLPFQLSPFKVNDPFIDARLFDILDEINRKLPNADITLTTNGSALTEAKLDRLGKVKRLEYLWVSVNDHRREAYEATMKLPYARTIERLDMIARAKADGRLPQRVVLSRVGDGSAVDGEFAAWVSARYPQFEVSIHPRGNWLGQVDTPVAGVPDVGCQRWFELSITATGTVAHCCMDGKAAFPVGDARTQHVLEIYNAPEYRRLREGIMTRRDVSPCNGCTFL